MEGFSVKTYLILLITEVMVITTVKMKIQTAASFFVLYFLCFCLGLGFGNMSKFGRIMLAFAYSERMIIGRISTGTS